MKKSDERLPAFRGVDIPNYEFLSNCMHCGMCLPVCPTYSLTGMERSSPRGRIRLIKAVADGELQITDGFIREMQFCLDCQACESACPAGVKYGSLVEAARTQIFNQRRESLLSTLIKKIFLGWMFQKPSRMHVAGFFMRIFDRFMKEPIRKSGLLRIVSPKANAMLGLAPAISELYTSKEFPNIIRPVGPVRYRVGFLTGCLMDIAYADVNRDTIALLLHHGCEVVIPKGQTCCGSLQAHYGMGNKAREFARQNIEAFEREDLDAIVLNSAGCGAFMKEYGHVLHDEPAFAGRAAALSARVKDLTEFLAAIGMKPARPEIVSPYAGKRVTYHDACHLAHTQKITRQPRELLATLNSFTYVELPESTWCCGSAGIYNIIQFDSAELLLKRKLENIKSVRPDIIVTANPGCMLQIQHGLEAEGLHIELVHTATFLRKSLIPESITGE